VRKLFIAVISLVVCLSFFSTTAIAAVPTVNPSQKVVDLAGLLTEIEISTLSQLIADASERTRMDFIVLTTDNSLGKSPRIYCEEFFDNNGFGLGPERDGMILYIDIAKRDVYFNAFNRAAAVFGPQEQNAVLDWVAPYLSDGRYYEACLAFVEVSEYYISGVPSGEIDRRYGEIVYRVDHAYGRGLTIPMAAIVAAIVSGAILLILFALHSKSLPQKPGIHTYFDENGLNMTRKEDVFLRTHTTRMALPKDGGGSGGGGSIGRSSGGSISRGSGRKF